MLKAIIFLAVVVAATAQTPHKLEITHGGGVVTYDANQETLTLTDVTEICNTGVWVVYTGQNYGGFLAEIFPNLARTCQTPYAENVGSARMVGIKDDSTAQSATLFSLVDLGGGSLVVGPSGVEVINQRIQSIVAINTNVELYEEEKFEGRFECLNLAPLCSELGVCWTWAINPAAYAWDITNAKSAKIGTCTPGVQGGKSIGNSKRLQ